MRRITVLCLLLGVAIVGAASGQSNYVFGVKPGNTINSAYFGLEMGRFVPMVGVDLVWISASAEYTDEDIEYYGTHYKYRWVDTDKIDGRAFLLIPHFGAKLYMGGEEVKPYLFGSIFFSIPSVKAESESRNEYWEYEDGVEVHYDVDTNTDELSKEDEDLIKDVLSFWGLSLGGGAEYFFTEHFSVGGEYGLRLLFDSAKQSTEDGDEYDSYREKVDSEASVSVKMSYALVTLNYHF